jgi:ketosteroid isomerase-like protein
MEPRDGQESRGDPDERPDREVHAYLEAYARALVAGDARAIAGMWDTPALVVDDMGVRAVGSRDEVEAFFASAREQYAARGIVDTRADVTSLDWATDRIVIVTVRWPYLDDQRREMGAEVETYTLRRNDAGDLRLVAVVMRGGTEPH